MRIVRKGLLIMAVVVLSLLALENVLTFGLMWRLGVSRGLWIAAAEYSVFISLLALVIWRGRLWPRK